MKVDYSGMAENLKSDLKKAINALEKQWIPCSERLPEESGEYLVWVEEVGCDVAWYEVALCAFGEWHHDALGLLEGELLELEDVVAWQPLPQPYREKVK